MNSTTCSKHDHIQSEVLLFVCFVYLRKIFEGVNHSLVWLKLAQPGISKQMLTLLQNVYANAKSRVRISRGEPTTLVPCQKGVTQGAAH